jgi:hypothetical protein
MLDADETQRPWDGLSALHLIVLGDSDFLGRRPRLVWFAPSALERRRTGSLSFALEGFVNSDELTLDSHKASAFAVIAAIIRAFFYKS